jgi:hypothetical protein
VGAPDFESRRLARLQESDPFGEPIEFTLYGREWRCVPLVAIDAMKAVDDAGEDGGALLAAILAFVAACVVDQTAWFDALSAQPLDEQTLADLSGWLGAQYGERWKLTAEKMRAEEEAAKAPLVPIDEGLAAKFSEARADTLETPLEAAHRRRVYKMAQIMQSGGDVAVPTDVEGYEAWEEARQVVAAGAVGAYADG